MSDNVFWENVIANFKNYVETCPIIEGEDISRALDGQPTLEELEEREAELENIEL